MKIRNLTYAFALLVTIGMISCDDGLEPVQEQMQQEQQNENENESENLDDAPDFSITTFDNNELKLSDYKDEVLVIFFFGNSCPPCIGVGPDIQKRLFENLNDKNGYNIIGMDQWDGNASSVESFATTTGISFPLGIKASGIAKDFGTTYDRLVVINKDGKIAYKGTSIAANNLDEVEELVLSLLN